MTGPPNSAREREARILRRFRALFEDPTGPLASESAHVAQEIELLFSTHSDRVYALCVKLTRDPERARDLAQETMLRGWQQLPSFRGESGLGTWLHVIARNLCFASIRKRSELLSDDGLVEVGSLEEGALKQLQRAEREELLRSVAQAVLDPIEQEAVYLRYVEQLGQEEIGSILELDQASGARGLLQRCRRKLGREIRRRLAELGHGSTFVRVVD